MTSLNVESSYFFGIIPATSEVEPFRIGSLQTKSLPDIKSRVINRTENAYKAAIFQDPPGMDYYLFLQGPLSVESRRVQDLIDNPYSKAIEIVSKPLPSEEDLLHGSNVYGIPVERLREFSTKAHNTHVVDLPGNRIEVLILSCLGGNGHEAARKAIEEQLSHAYNFSVLYPLKTMNFGPLPDFENLYNWLLKKGWNRVTNQLSRIVPPLLASSQSIEQRVNALVEENIQKKRPALLLSIAPIYNRATIQLSAKYNIPYLLVTTDFNLSNWVLSLEKINHIAMPRLAYTIGPDITETRGMLEAQGVRSEQIHPIGFPLRDEFYEEKPSREIICAELEIPFHKPVLLIMAGGSGGEYAHRLAKWLLTEPLNAHIIVASGRNKDLRSRVAALPRHASNSLTALGFTNRVSDYMRLSRILFTKPGPGTLEDAAALYRRYRNPFILVDHKDCLFWEKTGVDLMKDIGFKTTFTDRSDLIAKVHDHIDGEFPPVDVNKIPVNLFRERLPQLIRDLTN